MRAMALGFVLVKVGPADAKKVYEEILQVQGVEELFPLFGEYDFIVKLQAKDYNAMGDAVFNGIRHVPGVVSTETLTVTKM